MFSAKRILPAMAVPLVVAAASAAAAASAPQTITGHGVGKLTIGEPYATARAAGLIGPVTAGCPLDPGSKGARLRSPLLGNVELGPAPSQKITDIHLSRGATASGVGVGGTLGAIRSAYGRVAVDRSPVKVFGVYLATVHPKDRGQIQFALDAKAQTILDIAVPAIHFCD